MTYSLATIILPVHNQADHLEATVRQYLESLARLPLPHELLLVLNGCRDHSAEISEALALDHPSIRTIHSQKGGWGLAVNLGLAQARGDLLCYTNSARTSAQDLLLMLLYAVANPGIVIKANRKIRDVWLRRLGSLLYNLECRALFDLACWDINGSPKVFPRSFPKLMTLTRDDDLIDAEFAVVCRREGYPMLEVPVLSATRHGGKSTTNLRSAFHLYQGAFRMWKDQGRR